MDGIDIFCFLWGLQQTYISMIHTQPWFVSSRSPVWLSATGTDCGELSFESQGGKADLIPAAVCASARGKTEENIKWGPISPIKFTKCAVMVRRELGARCERAHKTLATAHLGFLAASAAAVAASEFLSDSAGSKRVDLLTFSLPAQPQFLPKLCKVGNSLHSTPWQTMQGDIRAHFSFFFIF